VLEQLRGRAVLPLMPRKITDPRRVGRAEPEAPVPGQQVSRAVRTLNVEHGRLGRCREILPAGVLGAQPQLRFQRPWLAPVGAQALVELTLGWIDLEHQVAACHRVPEVADRLGKR